MGRIGTVVSASLLVVTCAVLLVVLTGRDAPTSESLEPAAAEAAPAAMTVAGAASVLPLHFEENMGQAPRWVRYVARGGGPDLLLGAGSVSIGGVTLELIGANPGVEPAGLARLAARVDYFLGSDPDAWLTGVPAFEGVLYPAVFPGIDVRYHGDGGALEQDFVVAAHGDPGVIALGFDPSARVSLADGDLIVETFAGRATLRDPVAFQTVAGERREVDAEFRLDAGHVSFALGPYDASRELVIDPVIAYGSFLGGEMSDVGNSIAAEAGGTLFVTGRTGSADFPPGETDPLGNDAFVVGIDPSRSGAASLVYKAYLGGNNQDEGFGIAAGPNGTVYVTGKTQSTDFPTVNAFDGTNNAEDAFLTKLDPKQSGPAAIIYSTFLGGTGADTGADVAVDSAGRAHVTGETASANEFPLKNAHDDTIGGTDGFLVTIDPAAAGAAGLVYGTYLGGAATDRGKGVAVDDAGKALIAGETQSAAGFPLANAFDATLGGASDGFLIRLDPDATGAASLLYGTYLGGSGADLAAGVAPGSSGGALVAGETASVDFPARNPLFGSLGGAQDGFVAKLAPELVGDASLLWSTFLGGSDADQSTGVASDPTGNAFVGGLTNSTDFPTTPDRLQGDQAMTDAFITKIGESNPTTPVLLYSSYVGGSTGGPLVDMPFDRGNAIAADAVGSVAITGETFSLDVASAGPGFDTTCGSDGTCNGGAASDGWVTRTSFSADLQLIASAPAKPTVGKTFKLVLTVAAAGPDAATGVTVTTAAPSGVAIGTPASSQGSCATTGQSVTCNLGLMLNGATATVTVPLTPGSPGPVTLSPTVAAQEPDPAPADNTSMPGIRASANAKQPRLNIQTKRARVSKKGTVTLKLRCRTAAGSKCRGRARITSTKPLNVDRILARAEAKRVVKVADRRYTIRKGKARKLKLKLTREARAIVNKLGRLRVIVTVKGRDSSGARATVRRKIVIRAPAT